LRDVLDSHALSIQTAQLQRNRNYDDEIQHFDLPHSTIAPQWSYVDQNDMILNTEFERDYADEYERNDRENEEIERNDGENEEIEVLLTSEDVAHSDDHPTMDD